MPKTITRQILKLFGKDGSTSDFEQFGSTTAGSPISTKDVTLIQALSKWTEGWANAVYPTNKAPFLEDMNALIYVLCYQLAYVLQDGIPEWQNATSYYIGSIVRDAGTSDLYSSLSDDNLDNAFWHYIPQGNPAGTMLAYGGSSAPAGYLLCDGAAVSRTTYANLFNVIGTGYGSGNGTTTFNVPDLRGRVPAGQNAGTFTPLGQVVGAETHAQTQAAHSHTVNAHTHTIAHRHPSSVASDNPSLVAVGRTDGAGWPFGTTDLGGFQAGEVVAAGTNVRTHVLNTGDSLTANSGSASPGTDSQTPVISAGSSIQPTLVVNWIIKT